MKKAIVIILMLVYGLSSTGATVHFHYCCGKLDNISLSSSAKKSCPAKGISSKECCDSKHIELKVKGDQEAGAKWISTRKDFAVPLIKASLYLMVRAQEIPVSVYATGPPEKVSSLPLYIKNCVYRI
jgi:hypothetical protein